MFLLSDDQSNFNKFKFIKNLFELYGIYQFKIKNKELMEKSNIKINDIDIQYMYDFVSLIDQAISCLNNEEREIIKISFIDKVHYSKCNFSQSSFFSKRKKTSLKLYNLIFSQCKSFEIQSMIDNFKNN